MAGANDNKEAVLQSDLVIHVQTQCTIPLLDGYYRFKTERTYSSIATFWYRYSNVGLDKGLTLR